MDLINKLQTCAGYSESRAQAAASRLKLINEGLPTERTQKEAAISNFKPFLAVKESDTVEWPNPIPKKWAPDNKIECVLDVPGAFDPIEWS